MNEYTEIIIRTGIVYVAIITGLRILGRQHLGQLTISDFVLVLLISNAVQNAMVGNDTSLTGGIIAAITLLIINYLLSLLIFKSAPMRKLLSGEQAVLIYNGHYQEHNLRKFQITRDEIESIIREHGCENVTDIHSAVLEMDGAISVLPVAKGEKPEVYKHHLAQPPQKKEF